MTAAERKFGDIEAGLMRAQALARVLRLSTDGSAKDVDGVLWGGVYSMACEIETALDAAAEIYASTNRHNF